MSVFGCSFVDSGGGLHANVRLFVHGGGGLHAYMFASSFIDCGGGLHAHFSAAYSLTLAEVYNVYFDSFRMNWGGGLHTRLDVFLTVAVVYKRTLDSG